MSAFAQLKLTRELEQIDWVNSPAIFSEQLSAHLWATHQIDAFRAAAVDYVQKATASAPDPPLPTHRLGIAVIGQGVAKNEYRLFRKLRPQGVYYTQVKPEGGVRTLLEAAQARAEAHPVPYGHWYIDGGSALPVAGSFTRISYEALAGPRAALQERMQKTYEAAVFDPEAFRTMLAQIKPEEAGLGAGGDAVLNRFQLSLLTEGSGTQVFSTTFVQWAAREALRRAQPLTLVARFAPRQRERQMNELLAERQRTPETGSAGVAGGRRYGGVLHLAESAAAFRGGQVGVPGVVRGSRGSRGGGAGDRTGQTLGRADRAGGPGGEAGMTARVLASQRGDLEAARDKSAFLAWFEDHGEAVAVGPGIEPGKRSDAPIGLADLAARLA